MYKNSYLIAADEQSQAIRELLLNHPKLEKNTIVDSFDNPYIKIHDWFNGRETGYVLNVTPMGFNHDYSLNIAFYEHRNTDSIHILVWNQRSFNPVCTVDQANFTGLGFMESKWNTYYSFTEGEYRVVANFIVNTIWLFLTDPKNFIEELYANKGAFK